MAEIRGTNDRDILTAIVLSYRGRLYLIEGCGRDRHYPLQRTGIRLAYRGVFYHR